MSSIPATASSLCYSKSESLLPQGEVYRLYRMCSHKAKMSVILSLQGRDAQARLIIALRGCYGIFKTFVSIYSIFKIQK